MSGGWMPTPADFAAALGILEVPDPGLDPYLDATARCLLRYGLRRTSVPDIADELGVSRSTVYRRAGSVEDLGRKLLVRELHHLLRSVGPIEARGGPDAVIRVFASVVTFAGEHPVLRKLLRDEPELVGRYMVTQHRRVLAAAVPVVASLLRRAMRSGRIARRDPEATAEWLLRITLSLVLAPPLRDAETLLREMLLPVLSRGETPGARVR